MQFEAASLAQTPKAAGAFRKSMCCDAALVLQDADAEGKATFTKMVESLACMCALCSSKGCWSLCALFKKALRELLGSDADRPAGNANDGSDVARHLS